MFPHFPAWFMQKNQFSRDYVTEFYVPLPSETFTASDMNLSAVENVVTDKITVRIFQSEQPDNHQQIHTIPVG